jgi:2-isopropylmalate synthase
MSFDHRKYRRAPVINLADRQWPNRVLERALWCAVDLRDGNQALVEPMTVAQKLQMWALMTHIGFKHIEVGFPPPPSRTLTSCASSSSAISSGRRHHPGAGAGAGRSHRPHLRGPQGGQARHRPRLQLGQPDPAQLCVQLRRRGQGHRRAGGALGEYAARNPGTEWSFQYSPESFSSTEVEFAVEVCDAVIDEWRPLPAR